MVIFGCQHPCFSKLYLCNLAANLKAMKEDVVYNISENEPEGKHTRFNRGKRHLEDGL